MADLPKKPRLIDSPDPERPPAAPEPPRPKLRLGQKEFTDVNRSVEASTPPISVHAILAENLQHAVPHEQVPEPRRRRSRRTRDYWLCVVLGNALFGGVAFCFRHHPIVFVSSVAACTLFTVGLSWVMWQLMDDY